MEVHIAVLQGVDEEAQGGQLLSHGFKHAGLRDRVGMGEGTAASDEGEDVVDGEFTEEEE